MKSNKEFKNKIITDEQKVNILMSFYEWSGGFIPSQHHWDNEEDSPGLYFFIEDNSDLADDNENGLTDWFYQLNDDIDDSEIKSLMNKYPKLKQKLKSAI